MLHVRMCCEISLDLIFNIYYLIPIKMILLLSLGGSCDYNVYFSGVQSIIILLQQNDYLQVSIL